METWKLSVEIIGGKFRTFIGSKAGTLNGGQAQNLLSRKKEDLHDLKK